MAFIILISLTEPDFDSGKVDELVKRALPLGLQFDDDGQIDVFAFGSKAFDAGEYGLLKDLFFDQ